ncbi:MAG TPA: hypothetical protein VF695_05335 [Sphingomonas sp.]|jgi:hypothetical protein
MRILLFLSAILAALTGAIGPARAATLVHASASATPAASPAGTAITTAQSAACCKAATAGAFDPDPAPRWTVAPATPLWMLRPRE